MLITLAFLLGINTAVYAVEKQIVGWVEIVRIVPEGLKIKAKLDTGAQNSSLHAVQAEEFGRQAEKWVRFDLTFVDEQDRVAYYSEGPERIFQRSPGIIGKILPTPDSLP